MKTYEVDVVRIGYGFATIAVNAENAEKARELACEKAGDVLFSEKTSEYKADSVRIIKKQAKSQSGLEGIRISAEVHSDDRIKQWQFDATPWFRQAKAKDIVALARIEWGGDYASDAVAQWFSDRIGGVKDVFDYIAARNKGSKDTIGFECTVDSSDAMKWLEKNRSDVFEKVRKLGIS